MPKNPRQTIAPDHFTSTALSESSWRILGKVTENEVTLVRYFLSKIVYTDEVVTLEETCILFLSFEKMVQKMSQHEAYRAKYGSEVFTFRAVLTSLEDVVRANPQDRLKRMREVYGFYRGKLFSRRYYFSVRGQLTRELRLRVLTRFPKKFKPKAFVGKGYGDHGTAKEMAYDGSPSWQEVAMADTNLGTSDTSRFDYLEFLFRNFNTSRVQLFPQKKPGEKLHSSSN